MKPLQSAKSLIDLIQEDFPRTPSPVYQATAGSTANLVNAINLGTTHCSINVCNQNAIQVNQHSSLPINIQIFQSTCKLMINLQS
jgi:hypothetical protein